MQTRQVSNGATVAGIVLIVLGLVFFVVTQGAFDLNWSNIWPIFPMLVGGGMLTMAFSADSNAARAGITIVETRGAADDERQHHPQRQ